MSMISTQIDELRKLARAFPDTSPRAALLRDAADTIWQLRDDLQRANAENAKLRELCRTLCSLADNGLMELDDNDFTMVMERMRELGVEVDG